MPPYLARWKHATMVALPVWHRYRWSFADNVHNISSEGKDVGNIKIILPHLLHTFLDLCGTVSLRGNQIARMTCAYVKTDCRLLTVWSKKNHKIHVFSARLRQVKTFVSEHIHLIMVDIIDSLIMCDLVTYSL